MWNQLLALGLVSQAEDGVPLYEQIKRALRALIRDGTLAPHSELPSYRELCALTGASRITVRRAVRDLCAEGLLYTVPGKGTYVAGPAQEFEVAPFVGMTDDFAQRNQTITSKWLERTLVVASAQLSALLDVAVGGEVVKLARLRSCNGMPVALQTVYLPRQICPDILERELAGGSLYRTLREVYRIRLVSARTTIHARLARPEECQLLQVKSPAPLLCTRQLTFSDAGRPVEWAVSAFRADRYELSISHERALVPGQRAEL